MSSARNSRRRGLTLVELMVAMALMTVLTGTIIFIFAQAQTIYAHVDAKVKVYQYARTALDTMERDLANVVKSADMDFFQDGSPKNGHYDPGEALNNQIGMDMTEEKRLGLPMPPGNYHYGMTVRSPKYYTNQLFNDQLKQHAHDSIYFKTITLYQGQTMAAIVEYALIDMVKERPKLQKRVWCVTGTDPNSGRPLVNGSATATTPQESDLCLYVTDVKFQIFVKNNTKGLTPTEPFTPGTFYSAQDLVDAYMDPITKQQPFPALRNYWLGKSGAQPGSADYMIMCIYDPAHDPGQTDMGRFDKADNGLFHTAGDFPFPMLGPGDKVYPVKGWRDVPGVGKRIEFMERLSTTSPTYPSGPPQNECAYRAAWLPPAVRVTLKIKDEKAKEIRTISRTFKVLAST
jgi:prepilin-type N-terminal cleavage/methylation domain-containing protein